MAYRYPQTTIALDKEVINKLDAYGKANSTSRSRVIRAVLSLFPWWETTKTNIVLSVPSEVLADKEALAAWLDEAKKMILERV